MPLGAQSLSDFKGDHLSPQMYGAIGDGVADDTQAWIDVIAKAVLWKRTVRGQGTYKVTTQGTLNYASWDAVSRAYVFLVNDPVKIEGECTFLVEVDEVNNTNLFIFDNTTDVRISGITAIGVGVPLTQALYEGAAVTFIRCTNCIARDIQTYNMRGNTLMFNSENCKSTDSFSSIGIILKGVIDVAGTAVTWVSGDQFDVTMTGRRITIDGMMYTATINSTTSITLNVSGGTVTDAHYWFSSAGGSHFAAYGCRDVMIRDNSVYGGSSDGDIVHFGTDQNNLATGNRIIGCKLHNYELSNKLYGTVDVSGTAVTWVSGYKFTADMVGKLVIIETLYRLITAVPTDTSITLDASAGSLTSVRLDTRVITYNEAQGLLLDSGQEFGVIADNYVYGYFYGLDIKTTGEGNTARHNTIEKCKIGIAVRRGEGNAPTYNTKVVGNIIRPMGGNGNPDGLAGDTILLADGLTYTVGIYFQDSPGLSIEDNLIEASWLFGSGEQDFISIAGVMDDINFVLSALDGPWIRNNRFMQVMNIGGFYTYSKNVAIHITGSVDSPLQRGCIDGNDLNLFVDEALPYHPISLRWANYFSIRNNTLSSVAASIYPSILAENCSVLTISGNQYGQSAGFIRLADCDMVKVLHEAFGNMVRDPDTDLPVPVIYGDTITNIHVIGCSQTQDPNVDNGRLVETSASGNRNFVIKDNILNFLIFSDINDWYEINGVSGNTSQDIAQSGNILNGRLTIGPIMSSRTWAFRSNTATGKWAVDGVDGDSLAAANNQTLDLPADLPPLGKFLMVNFTVIQGFSAAGLTSLNLTMGDSVGGAGFYISLPFSLLTTGAFIDLLPLNAAVFQTGSNPTVKLIANQNLNAATLTGAFSITVQWVSMTKPNFTV